MITSTTSLNTSLNTLKTQVLVVGSGAAGISAAIAAARGGAQVILVERHGFLGGLSTGMPWFGFHDRDYRQVVKGLPTEFVKRLQALGAASEPCYDPKCGSGVNVNGHIWKCLAMEMMNSSGVRVMFHTLVVDTLREGDRITGIVVEHKSGRQDIQADVVIDCSGDGDVAARGGVDYMKGRDEDGLVQSPSAIVRIGGMDRESFLAGVRDKSLAYREWIAPYPDLWDKMMKRLDDMPMVICGGYASLLTKAREAGDLTIPQTRVVGATMFHPNEFVTVMTRVLGMDPTDTDSVSDVYARIYPQVLELIRFYRKYVPGFAHSYVQEILPMLGIRESRCIVGQYVLTVDDLVDGNIPEDTIALSSYHVDIHRPSGTWVESRNVQTYGIPLRCLIAKEVDGLLMAGKCISATHEAVASTRVVITCMAQGEAAGTTAAIAVRRGVAARQLDASEVRQTLMKQGAEVGQTVGPPNFEAIEQVGQLPLDEPISTDDASIVQKETGAWLSAKS